VLKIRPSEIKDRDSVWEIFHAVAAEGTAYAFDPEMPRTEAMAWWEQPSAHRYVAELDGGVAGIFLLKPNQPGLGAHVANAAFMVAESARGSGVGRAMGEHCLAESRRLGFRAIQFNFVVSTNEAAVRLWKRLGFEIAATLPGAFRHAELGYVDVYVMFRTLEN